MALSDKRILTRNERLNLTDVYGADPFKTVRNLNQPIEAVTKRLNEVRMSLGKKMSQIQGLISNVKGLRGMFDATDLKNSLLDKLGINLFKRNLADLKNELNAWGDLLGIKTRDTIDKLNSSSTHALGSYETDFYAYFKDQIPSSSTQMDKLNSGVDSTTNPNSPGSISSGAGSGNTGSGSTGSGGVTPPTVVDPVTSTEGKSCSMPSIKPSTTATGILGLPGTDIVQSVIPAYPVNPTPYVPVTADEAIDKIDPIQACIAIALAALALNEYDRLSNLPASLKPIVAELLVAMGLDMQHGPAIVAGLTLGNLQDLEESFPGLLQAILAIVGTLKPVVLAVNNNIPVFKPVSMTRPVYDELKEELPTGSSIEPTPLIVPIQTVVALAVITTSSKRRYFNKVNYAHTYHPRIS